MANPEIPFNTAKDSKEAVRQAHYDLERTQPVDQIKEGEKWDRKVAGGRSDNSSARSKRR